MAISGNIKGLGPLLDRLRTLPAKLQAKELRSAMRKGATLVRKSAIAKAHAIDDPVTKEKIYANVVVHFAPKLSKREGGIAMQVGILGGAKQYGNTKENVRKRRVGKTYKTGGDKGNPGGDTWYWRFVEFGIPSRGIEARPFLLPALEQNAEAATGVIAASLRKAIDRLAAKGGA